MPRRSRRLEKTFNEDIKLKNGDAKDRLASSKSDTNMSEEDNNNNNNNNEEEEAPVYFFEGTKYESYQDMVDAKRKRNQEVLRESGLLTAVQEMKSSATKQKQQGLKKRKKKESSEGKPVKRRTSNRLAGIKSDGLYVEEERAGRFTFATESGKVSTAGAISSNDEDKHEEPEHYRGRINDGEDISVPEAVESTGPKWLQENSVAEAEAFVRGPLVNNIVSDYQPRKNPKKKKKTMSPKSVTASFSPPRSSFLSKVDALAVDDDECVAKVTPDRIFGIAAHPSADQRIVSAGDKTGFVGIWNVDSRANDDEVNDGLHLFRFHSRSASCLQWNTSGSALFSASYDGTVRWFDVASENFQEIFATFDSDSTYVGELGFGLDSGHKFWTQYACLDQRFSNEQCFFLSTSVGTAMHIDLRARGKGKITFHEKLSEKKINTLSLHSNGYSMVSGGLDNTVKVWDIRKFGDNRSKSGSKDPAPVAMYNCGRSINSAYFSPSGRYMVSTTMANKLDLFDNAHLASSSKKLKPAKSIRHDNMTGRWLSTFMASWHPELDVFCVGSMRKPRAIELFDAQGKCLRAVSGEALTAVASRCCFHRSTDKLILFGGNSSGRVTVVR